MRWMLAFAACAMPAVAHADPVPGIEVRAAISENETSGGGERGAGLGYALAIAGRVSSDTFVGAQASFTSFSDSSDPSTSHDLVQLHAFVEVHFDPIAVGVGLGFDRYASATNGTSNDDQRWGLGAHVQLAATLMRRGASALELVGNLDLSPILDVPFLDHGDSTADIVTCASLGIAFRYL